jgi:hypothetical protein
MVGSIGIKLVVVEHENIRSYPSYENFYFRENLSGVPCSWQRHFGIHYAFMDSLSNLKLGESPTRNGEW